MSDKDLSKPIAWCDETALTLLREENFGVMMYPTAERGGEKALYSHEYVQSLLGRIAELEVDMDTWQASALALRDMWREETHHNGMMQLSNELAKANARIAELEREKSYATFQPVAARDVLKERLRQVTGEGWTPEHDDQHSSGELARAAACYAVMAVREEFITDGEYAAQQKKLPFNWPWDPAWWKPVSPRRDLVRAGALILAEIDRIDRCKKIVEPGDSDD